MTASGQNAFKRTGKLLRRIIIMPKMDMGPGNSPWAPIKFILFLKTGPYRPELDILRCQNTKL